MKKLPITEKLLSMDSSCCGETNHQKTYGSSEKKFIILMFLLLFTITGYGQLASEDFESGIPTGWVTANSTSGLSSWTTSTDGYLSDGAAFMDATTDNLGNGNTARYYLITPLVTIPENGQLRFYTKQGDLLNHGTEFEIRLSTANQPDISGFTTVLETFNESNLTTTSGYEEKIIDIPEGISGLQVYIAFVLVNNQTSTTPTVDTWLVDNVSLQTEVVCEPVLEADFSAINLTTGSATLNWTHPTETDFQIQVIEIFEVPGVNGTPTDNSYDISSLDEGTEYHVYIKTLCADSSSGWAGPFSFTTLQAGASCTDAIPVGNLVTPYTTTDDLIFYINPDLVLDTPGQGCTTQTFNYASANKAFYTYTADADGVIRITFSSTEGYTGVFVYEGCDNVGLECVGGEAGPSNAPRVIDLMVEAGTQYVVMLSGNMWPGANVPYTLTIEKMACPIPSDITVSSIMQTSANISWGNLGGYATSWEIAVVNQGSGAPVGAGVSAATNSNFAVSSLLGGAPLVAGTSYDVYVRANCGSGFTAWSSVYNFTTQCAVFPTPYTETFDGANSSAPTLCWTPVDINGDGQKWGFSWENASMYTGDSSGNNNDLMSSPMIDLGTTPKRLRFTYQTVSGVSRFAVVLSTTGIGGENFTTVLLPTDTYDTNYEIVEKIVNIPTSITGNVNIAWYIDPGTDETASRLNIDDIIIEDKPACSNPVDLTANTITTTGAQLTWTAGDAEEQWQIVVQPAGTGIPTGMGELVSDNTYDTPPLTHATQYEYYVRAYCSSTLQSEWVGPFAFITLCDVFDVPFYESFNDDDPNTHKFCWVMADVNADGAQWNMNPTEPSIQGNPWFGTPEYNDWLISPAINVEGTKAVKFKYKSAFSFFFPNPRFGVEVLMSTTDTNPESFTVVGPLFEFTNTDYIEKTVYITANGPVYIAFRVPPSFSTADGTSILQIDDVKIEDAPLCPNPSEQAVSNITQTTAILSWTAGYQETEWEIAVQPAGEGVPTTDGEITDNNTAYPAGSLIANTQYEYYIKAICNDTDESEWIGPFVFTTLCDVYTTPFIETFENDSESEECWRMVNGNSDSYAWSTNVTTYPYEGQHSAGIFTGSNGNNDDWLISPTITVTAGQRLRYYYRVHDSFFEEDLEVLLSTTGVEPASFTTVLYNTDDDPNPLNNMEFKEKVINLPPGTVGNINIAWHIPEEEPSWMGYRGQLLIIDKVIIEDIPACAEPSNLSVTNIADVQAELHWDANGTETAWDVYVQPAGLGTPVGDGDPQYLHNTSDNPYIATDLIPASQYEFYVRAACGGDNSEWIGPTAFTTMCSFETSCEYTITLHNPAPWGDISGSINVVQNEVTTTQLQLTSVTENGSTQDFIVFLCDGVEFSLYWDAIGWAPGTGGESTVTVTNQAGEVVWASPPGIGTPKTTIYESIASCSPVTCPAPINLAVNANGVLSWTPGGTETEWEVFIQPADNGTLPQSGTIVTTNSYTPTEADFELLTAGTYEFFVRAICGTDDNSYWSGPSEFVTNDDSANAIQLPVNTGEICENSATAVTFTGATPSSEPMVCSGTNNGDVWFGFEAASKVHIIELGNFSGDNQYSGYGNPPYPKVVMTLYKVNGTALEQMSCTYNNAVVAAYTTELEIGAAYKVRLTLTDGSPNAYTFDVCVKTPLDPCSLDAVNGDLESPDAAIGGLTNFYTQRVVPGWRNNYPETEELHDVIFYIDALNAMGLTPYDGGQMIQLITSEEPQDPSDLINIKGLYQDFDSSEVTKYDYSYAHAARSQDSYMQLYAGPPSGPFVLLEEHLGEMGWHHYQGEYNVPEGQTVTRFIFRSKDNAIGNVLDAVSIVADNALITEPHAIECGVTATTLEAEGMGTWVSDDENPGAVVITSPDSKITTVTGFTVSGDYTFYWRTRYCEYSVVVTFVAAGVPVTAFTYNDSYCTTGEDPTPAPAEGFTVGGTFTAAEGMVIDPVTGVIDLKDTAQGVYTVTYTVPAQECMSASSSTVTVTITACEIPRGISPNGDTMNDSFDLSGFGVTKLNIFNRYGREVYQFTGDYTSEWHGQDNKNNELPTGTYFYSLHKSDGTSKTGWVYINREL